MLESLASVLSVITSKLLDTVYRVAASVLGLLAIFGGIAQGPVETLGTVLTYLGAPSGWTAQVATWVDDRSVLVAVISQALILLGVLALYLTESWPDALSQRSSSTIWVGVAGASETTLSLWAIGIVMVLIAVAGGISKNGVGDVLNRTLIGLFGALVYAVVWPALWTIGEPRIDRSVDIEQLPTGAKPVSSLSS